MSNRFRRNREQVKQLARLHWMTKLGDAERELVELGLACPTSQEEADKLSSLVKKYLPEWPDKTKSPCCIQYFNTRRWHNPKCKKKFNATQTASASGPNYFSASRPPVQTASLHPKETVPTSSRTNSIPLCKPHLHGQLPTRPQERPFAELLLNLDIPEKNAIDVWFTQLLGTPDIDAIIVCRNVGLFVIELKSWGLGAVERISGVEGFQINEGVRKSTTKTPWQQAFEAGDALSDKIASSLSLNQNTKRVWISRAASLFKISRESFLRKFSGPESNADAVQQIERGVLFAEDLLDSTALVSRLRYIKANPLHRKKPNKSIDNPLLYSDELVEDLEQFINFKIVPTTIPTKSDLERLQRIEREEERELDKVDLGSNVLCTGYAGTGKTVLGLQAVLRKQSSALFTCFNKVLATDIKRLTGFSTAYQAFPFDVYDIFDLIETCEARLELKPLMKEPHDEPFDCWADRRVSRVIETDKLKDKRVARLWQFVVVDEAQDLKDYGWKLLDWLSCLGAPLFVVDGKKQQLYRNDRAEFLDKVLPESIPPQNKRQKNRIFRTTSETFLLGQLFVETYPSAIKAHKRWSEKYQKQYLIAKSKTSSQSAFDFELARQGAAPSLYNLASLTSDGAFDFHTAVQFVAAQIKTALQRLEPFDVTPSDILVLVPFTSKKERHIDWKQIAVEACLHLGLDYLDYGNNDFRRVAYSPSDIRIATYHSSRGIEASHSVLLGVECLSAAAKENNEVAANLGYISLTRSLFETDIVFYRSPAQLSVDVSFLEKLMAITGF